ncbi:MAG TPA: ABC transporter ATP-binding protein, partial [Pyrinomonadaceae bacterium]|nr:ABC transporter ATP-binding protein [Pyrinomonadaceae bacterium]
MVFQNYALYPHMTVRENIGFALSMARIPKAAIKARTEEAAALLGLTEYLERLPKALSGGQRQRVAMGRAIVRSPQVFLMDEPLSNLDARLRVQTRGELKRLQHDLGTTTVYVTHDQAEAMTLAHRVAVMRAGRLQQFDTPLNVYARPANRFVAEFVGSPAMNFVEGRFDAASRSFVADSLALRLPAALLARAAGRERVTLGLRPEHVRVLTQARDGSTPAHVYVTELMGSDAYVFLRLAGGHKLIARAGADFRAEPETPVWAELDLDRAELFDAETGDTLREGD